MFNGNIPISEPIPTNNPDDIVLPDNISPSDDNNQNVGQTNISTSPTNKPSSTNIDSIGNYLVEPVIPTNTHPPPGPHVNEVDHEVDEDYLWNSSDVIDIIMKGDSSIRLVFFYVNYLESVSLFKSHLSP